MSWVNTIGTDMKAKLSVVSRLTENQAQFRTTIKLQSRYESKLTQQHLIFIIMVIDYKWVAWTCVTSFYLHQ